MLAVSRRGYSQFNNEWMSNPFEDGSLRVDVLDLLQSDNLGLFEHLHGKVRQLAISMLRRSRGWQARVLGPEQVWKDWMI